MWGAIGGIVGSVISAVSGYKQAKEAKKAARRQAEEQRRQALANVRVQSSSGEVEMTEAKSAEEGETAAQSKQKRRYGLGKTILKGGLLGSSTGNRMTLGGQ